jgi:hypothetical protein
VIELFKCVPLGTKLARSSCGKRHTEAGGPRVGNGVSTVRESACRACPIGAAHARGETPTTWPTGEAVVVVQLGDLAVAPPPLEHRRGLVEIKRASRPARASNAGSSVAERAIPNREVAGSMPARRVQSGSPSALEHGAQGVRAPRAGAAPIRAGAATPTASNEGPMAKPQRNGNEYVITAKGETLNLTAWGKRLGVSAAAVRQRLNRRWTEEEAVTTPKGETPARLTQKAAKEEKPARKTRPRSHAEVVDTIARTADAAAVVPAALDLPAALAAFGIEAREVGTTHDGWQLMGWRLRSA